MTNGCAFILYGFEILRWGNILIVILFFLVVKSGWQSIYQDSTGRVSVHELSYIASKNDLNIMLFMLLSANMLFMDWLVVDNWPYTLNFNWQK